MGRDLPRCILVAILEEGEVGRTKRYSF